METKKETRGGARPGAGRPSREQNGLSPVRGTFVKVEDEVIAACRSIHGSLADALRYAAKKKIKPL